MNIFLKNEHYFDVIDTPAKAYLLGFIAADGALVKSTNRNCYYLTITIKHEDKALLEFMQQELQSTHKLLEIFKSSYGKPIHHIRLAFSNKFITQALLTHGITPRKSLTMPNIIANIPIKYRGAFIIGYFDGDGSISQIHNSPNNKSLHIQIRGTQQFLEGIANTIGMPTTFIYQHDSIPQLSITNKQYQKIFFSYYNNLPFYYTRKYNKFLGYL